MARGLTSKIKRFNINVERIKDLFEEAPSEKYVVRTRHARVIKGSGSNRGQIRTYQETIDYMQRSSAGRELLKSGKYNKASYEREVQSVFNQLGKRATYKGEYSHQRQKMIKQLNEYRKEYDFFDISKSKVKSLTTLELLEAYREAEKLEREYRNTKSYDSRDSETGWSALLQKEIEKIYNRKELLKD